MTGDDSVGWWLLMEFGRYPPAKSLSILSERLKNLATGKSLGSAVLYTFTAISRTLRRSNFPLETVPELKRTWESAAVSTFASGDPLDQIWLLQMATEIWPDLARKYSKLIRSLSESKISKGLIQSSAIVLMNSLRIEVPHSLSRLYSSSVKKMLESGSIVEKADWHVAYDVWASLVCGVSDITTKLGDELVKRQSKGEWDTSSEECVESTSLCGLALMDLSMRLLPPKNRADSRSRIVHEVSMLLDNYAWLLQNWQVLQQMPKTQSKGDAFERFIEDWVSQSRDLTVRNKDLLGGTDEIDFVLEFGENTSLSTVLHQSRYILVECKHRSEPTGAKEVRAFRDSLRQRRKENCQLGVYISTSGFSSDARSVGKENLGDEQVLLLLDGKTIETALRSRMSLSNLISENLKDAVLRRPA